MSSSSVFRYLLIAGVAYFIDLGGFWILLKIGVEPIFANIIVKINAAIFGFFAHRRFTYNIRTIDNFRGHAFKYFGLALIYTPISTYSLFWAMKFISSPVYSKIFSDVAMLVVTYVITTRAVFTKSKVK